MKDWPELAGRTTTWHTREDRMTSMMRMARNAVFGLAVAGSLGFGTTQAVAAPRDQFDCTGPGEIYLGTCPGKDCSGYCDGVPGRCSMGCCTCQL
jgi:hypothetical protein